MWPPPFCFGRSNAVFMLCSLIIVQWVLPFVNHKGGTILIVIIFQWVQPRLDLYVCHYRSHFGFLHFQFAILIVIIFQWVQPRLDLYVCHYRSHFGCVHFEFTSFLLQQGNQIWQIPRPATCQCLATFTPLKSKILIFFRDVISLLARV